MQLTQQQKDVIKEIETSGVPFDVSRCGEIFYQFDDGVYIVIQDKSVFLGRNFHCQRLTPGQKLADKSLWNVFLKPWNDPNFINNDIGREVIDKRYG